MMRQPTPQDLKDLLADHRDPCITLYQETHRYYPGIQEDQIRFKNLLTEADNLLAVEYKSREYRPLLRQIESIAATGRDFWTHLLDGMAIFCSPDFFRAFSLQTPPMENSVTVNATFRTKPLIRVLQAAGRYQVLCFEEHNVRLFEGNEQRLDPVELRDVPRNSEQLTTNPYWMRHYLSSTGSPQQPVARITGQRQVDLEHEYNTELMHFMRIVDRAVWENHSRDSGLPLVLCAAESDHPLFRQITINPNLLSDGIKIDPHYLTDARIKEESWKVIDPHNRRRVEQIVDAFRTAQAQNRASDALETVTEAASTGRVATLLVDAKKHIPGYLDPVTGQMQWGSPQQESRLDDVLDETAERVLRMGGQVLVIPPETMPTDSGMAAIYRY